MPDPQAVVRAYHQRSKHQLQRYAAGPETLDWDAQPDPWRRYAGAPVVLLPLGDALPASAWPDLFHPGGVPPQRPDLASLGMLLRLGLGLSAWKQQGPDRWAVRCNPSSGNLHPTEAHVLARGLPGLADGLYHYAPRAHLLERRALLAGAGAGPPGLWLGLSSIHWREAWKYGERAFRYCQLDVGHALGALRYAAAVLGWRLRLLPGLDADHLAHTLGLAPGRAAGGAEPEDPEALLQVLVDADATAPPPPGPAALGTWAGTPNRLDAHPMYRWPVIDEVAQATRPRAAGAGAPDLSAAPGLAGAPAAVAPTGGGASPVATAAGLILQRRSAQRFDRRAPMAAAVLQRLAAALQPGASLPWDLWPHPVRLHPVYFVNRVQGWAPGAYALPRAADAAGVGRAQARLAAAMAPGLHWRPVAGSPLWHLADNPALAGTLRTLCCHQALASDANLVVVMLAEFDAALAADGPAAYRQLLQEAGLLGQVLYLEAEALGHRGTGIGCFFDDGLHDLLGITDSRLQALYHFTLGTALDDDRIASSPPYDLAALRPQEASA